VHNAHHHLPVPHAPPGHLAQTQAVPYDIEIDDYCTHDYRYLVLVLTHCTDHNYMLTVASTFISGRLAAGGLIRRLAVRNDKLITCAGSHTVRYMYNVMIPGVDYRYG